MADVYEKDLGQKSSLTANDFIRVVGSDNVSYKQRLSDVSDKVLSMYPSSLAVDVLAWAEGLNGFGITRTNGNSTNLPSGANKYGVAWCNNYVAGTVIWCNLFYSPSGATDIYVCQKSNASAWTAWEKMPTRAEIDDAHRYKGGVVVDDFNDITDTGIYYAKGKSTTLNPPLSTSPGRYYQLLVTHTDNWVSQIATSNNAPNTIYTRIANNGTWSDWVIQPTRAEIDALNSKSALTLNYTSNPYVTEATLKGSEARKIGNLLVLKFNSSLADFPSGSSVDNTQIGTISGWNGATAINVTVSPQNGTTSNGILLLTISNAGVIQISNRSGLPCNGFYRTVVVTATA